MRNTIRHTIFFSLFVALPVTAQAPDLSAFKQAGQQLKAEHLPAGKVMRTFASNAKGPLTLLKDTDGFRASRVQFVQLCASCSRPD